jgi:acetyl-CoA carboxylase biotin carboxyl carrier protein
MSQNNKLDSEVHHLVELLTRHELAELEVEHKGLRIRVRRGGVSDVVPTVVAAPGRQTAEQPGGQADTASAAAPDSLVTVSSPIVGTFYRSPSPDADPYVDEGDFVKKGQVLCIVEAMKLMNEIESEYAGVVREILVQNGQPVEYGQALIVIE